ncbi:MAG: hypothetical protein HY553_04215 [Elusimicrobia bacterium]|nr:hypothetical protein [Elusimicrobiota bacterium]
MIVLPLVLAAFASAASVTPVLDGWVQQDGDVITILAPDRTEAFEIKDAIEPAILGWSLPRRYVYAIAKTHPNWTKQRLLDHLDYALRQEEPALGALVFENIRFQPTPELRARLKALRARGRIVFFLRHGPEGAPAM